MWTFILIIYGELPYYIFPHGFIGVLLQIQDKYQAAVLIYSAVFFSIHVWSGLIYLLAIEFNDSTMILLSCVFLLDLEVFFFCWLPCSNHFFFVQVLQATMMKQMEIEAALEALKDSIVHVS